MELKKSEKADLEKKKLIFSEIGLIVSLFIVFIAFECSSSQSDITVLTGTTALNEEIDLPEVTRDEPEPPKPEIEKPPVEEEKIADEIEVTEDKAEDQSDLLKANTDDTDAKIEQVEFKFAEPEEVKETIHVRVEKMPSFPGGDAALIKFLSENLVYPQEAADLGLQGVVIVKFVVGKDGKARNPEILKSVAPMLDRAAMAVVNKLPLFTPGEQAGEKVMVYYTLPVQFKLAQ